MLWLQLGGKKGILSQKFRTEPHIVALICNPSSQEARLGVRGQSGLYGEFKVILG